MRNHQECMQQIDWMLDKWEDMASRRHEQDENELRRQIFEEMYDEDDCHLSMSP